MLKLRISQRNLHALTKILSHINFAQLYLGEIIYFHLYFVEIICFQKQKHSPGHSLSIV